MLEKGGFLTNAVFGGTPIGKVFILRSLARAAAVVLFTDDQLWDAGHTVLPGMRPLLGSA
jgi:hypothetical protein